MFSLDVPAFVYRDPWILPLAQRLCTLSRGRRKVAYYYESPNNSTFRYRAYNMAQVLNDGEPGPDDEQSAGSTPRPISASWFHSDDLHAVEQIADTADQLVICRSGYDASIARLLAAFRVRGKPVQFDVDDLVFDTDYTHLIVDTLGLDKADPRVWDDWFGMIGRMGHTLKQCDGAITTNAVLAQQIRRYCSKPVAVVPNFMNREQLEMSRAVFEQKQRAHFRGDGRIVVGYFSGSPSHNLDFAIVQSALAALLESDPRVHVMAVGYIEPGPALAGFGKRLLHRPFQDYVNLQRLLGSVEINLMPLQANAFTACKSELKYFEAAAVGTLSVASPSPNYAAAIDHGRTGWLARAHQWQRVLQAALSASDAGPNGYADMACRAHDDALQRFAWRHQAQAIRDALDMV